MKLALRGVVLRAAALAVAVATVAITAGLAAGSTSHPSRTSVSSGTTLTVWTMEDSKAFASLVSNFTKQTGVKVNVEAIPWGNVNDKLTTAVASGNGPDVVQVGLSLLPTFVGAGALLNLKPYLQKHAALGSANYLDGVAANKINPARKVLSIPWVSDVRVLFYRKDILSQAGISSPPKTWTQFYNDATKLASRGSGQYGLYIPQWDSALPVELAWQAGGTVQDRHGLVTFNTAAFKRAADFYISFYKSKLVPTASDFDQTQGFISGAAPMVISGPYLAGAINGAAPDLKGKWGVALLPKDKTGTSLFAGSNMGVWYKSKHVNESLRLLDYLSNPKEQLTWFKLTNELPTLKAAMSTKALTADPMVSVYIKQLQDAQLLPPLVPAWGQISSAMLDALNSIVLKGADEKTTLAQLNQKVASLQRKQ
jgi:multiple sugar transport system substrate-binding protein